MFQSLRNFSIPISVSGWLNNCIITGNKWSDKKYISYTGYPGGQRVKTAQQLYDKNPSIIVEKAVKGMLPKNKLGAAIFKNLRVYNDELHKQESQSPEPINLNNI